MGAAPSPATPPAEAPVPVMDGSGVVPLARAGDLDPVEVGAKAASLVLLAQLGLRVPPAFVVTSAVGREHRRTGAIPARAVDGIHQAVAGLERATGRRFGGAPPLLVAVRSGASESMPGMMDTVLDVGFGPDTFAALAELHGETFAGRCRDRFLAGFGSVVLGIPTGGTLDPGAAAPAGRERVPIDPGQQLLDAVAAVFASWDNDRARAYRAHHGIDDTPGTAVIVQAMAFGDRDAASGSGVAFSRDPDTGHPLLCGDFLAEAQGQDVVAGTHRPQPLAALAEVSAGALAELEVAVAAVEAATRDMVDVEFAVESGVLHVLQHRPGPRTAAAAVRIAVDLVDEGVISVEEALARVPPEQEARAARRAIAEGSSGLLATGVGACAGAAAGEVCLSAEHVGDHDGPVVLVRPETSPDDVAGMVASAAILTAAGGLVSHAALVARELDLPAVVGVGDLVIDQAAGTVAIGGRVLREGDVITVDGGSGRVHAGAAPVIEAAPSAHLRRLREWRAAAERD